MVVGPNVLQNATKTVEEHTYCIKLDESKIAFSKKRKLLHHSLEACSVEACSVEACSVEACSWRHAAWRHAAWRHAAWRHAAGGMQRGGMQLEACSPVGVALGGTYGGQAQACKQVIILLVPSKRPWLSIT